MQIVINIDGGLYEWVHRQLGADEGWQMVQDAIMSGKVLPKGHGDLIDADELYDDFIDGTEGYDCQTWNRIEIGDIIEDVPTIIEADRSEGE